jgi:dynein light chain LC8-type
MHSNRDGGGEGKAPSEGVFLGKLRISYSDATTEVTECAIEAARSALQRLVMKGTLKHFAEVAQEVRDDIGKKYPGTWHCIVGKSFGSMVTHETGK